MHRVRAIAVPSGLCWKFSNRMAKVKWILPQKRGGGPGRLNACLPPGGADSHCPTRPYHPLPFPRRAMTIHMSKDHKQGDRFGNCMAELESFTPNRQIRRFPSIPHKSERILLLSVDVSKDVKQACTLGAIWVRYLVVVGILNNLYECILMVRIVQDGNLQIKCLSLKLLNFPPTTTRNNTQIASNVHA